MSLSDYSRPSVTVDLVMLTIREGQLEVLLIRRGGEPFKGQWALPGGFVDVSDDGDQGEDLEDAARRELREETGLDVASVYLEQLYTYGDAGRDPRGRVISVAYYALIPPDLAGSVAAGSDAAAADWFDVDTLERLRPSFAFDHASIFDDALARVRGKIDWAPAVALNLVPDTFTVAELRAVHDVIKGRTHDRVSFRKRFRRMIEDATVEVVPDAKRSTGGKPATLHRFKR